MSEKTKASAQTRGEAATAKAAAAHPKKESAAKSKGAMAPALVPHFKNLVILTDFGDSVANAQVEMRFRNVCQWVQDERTQRQLMPQDVPLPTVTGGMPAPAVMHVMDIPFGNIDYAGYAAYCCYRALGRSRPNLFIHACDPQVGRGEESCALETDYGNIFIGPDNGTLGLLKTYFADREIETKLWILDSERLEELEQYRMEEPSYHIPRIFHGRDIFAVAAGLVAGGVPLAAFAEEKEAAKLISTNFAEKLAPLPLKLGQELQCFAFRDNTYGNLKLNLTLDSLSFDQLVDDEAVFKVSACGAGLCRRSAKFTAKHVFSDVQAGAGVLFLGSTFAPEWDTQLVELALNLGNASAKLGLPQSYSGAAALTIKRLR